MPRFAANLSMLFTEVPFPERFERAARAGFSAVEFLFPYEFPAQDIARRLTDNGLENVLFNTPPGDWEAGESQRMRVNPWSRAGVPRGRRSRARRTPIASGRRGCTFSPAEWRTCATGNVIGGLTSTI